MGSSSSKVGDVGFVDVEEGGAVAVSASSASVRAGGGTRMSVEIEMYDMMTRMLRQVLVLDVDDRNLDVVGVES